jgi:hypothetical protein
MKESVPSSGYPTGGDHPEDAGSSTLISRAFVPPCIPAVANDAEDCLSRTRHLRRRPEP